MTERLTLSLSAKNLIVQKENGMPSLSRRDHSKQFPEGTSGTLRCQRAAMSQPDHQPIVCIDKRSGTERWSCQAGNARKSKKKGKEAKVFGEGG